MNLKRLIATVLAVLCAAWIPATQAAASGTSKPAWKVTSTTFPTNLTPGSTGEILVVAQNIGAETSKGVITIRDVVSGNLEVTSASGGRNDLGAPPPVCEVMAPEEATCTSGATGSGDIVFSEGKTKVTGLINSAGAFAVGNEIQGTGIPPGTTIVAQSPAGSHNPTELTLSDAALPAAGVELTVPSPIRPGYQIEMSLAVKAPPGVEATTNEATVEGGGAVSSTTASPLVATPQPAPFAFLPGTVGLDAFFSDPDGAAATQAGSHPYQLTVDVGFPTKEAEGFLVASGHLRDATVDLPPGTIVNPTASGELCTEAQLVSNGGCPDASAVGTAAALTYAVAGPEAQVTPLYNMVPPPGVPAEFAFNALGIGVFVHILGEVRSDGDYGLSGGAPELLALPLHPVFGSRLNFWGDPSAESHDPIRGHCAPPTQAVGSCEVPRQNAAFLSLPGRCSPDPLIYAGRARSWEEPDQTVFATYQSADLAGTPLSISGCNALEFSPTISSRPTTNLTDSPSGLEFNLHQPQNPELDRLSPAILKDAVVTLPEGVAVNPSSANGQGACSSSQIGLTTPIGATPIHFSKSPDSCPDSAKIGTVEVKTPLLAQTDETGTKFARDPETGAVIPRPLHGSVYLAKPFDNPFDSLLAIYISIDDPQSGTVAKFAGKVETDPATGQITTLVSESPQLPIEDVTLRLFGGARASLITPLTCATHTTSSDLTPWSTPEGADSEPQDSFQTTAAPGGGACPTNSEAAPSAPEFNAGTIDPQAGAYSPFVLRLSREDGTQRLTKIDTTLPPGLIGRLAGVGECSEAQIALAQAREAPNGGAEELNSPSCPASSLLGSVEVAAGAGPTPFHTTGRVYLAGPYRGAPLSLAVITPAIAGPFDLGTVLSRVALRIDPETTQIHATSDPLPTILDGIPLDIRSIALRMDRPNFTLNPTSCDPMAITGMATSALNQLAPLTSPFQVGGCAALAFKPKLGLELKGKTKRTSHPKLIANLTAKPGEANIARTQVRLPKAAFLDNAHIKTICTRVQFAAEACPPGSIYGKVSATTPLLDYPLTGNVYLRSSSHQLPDLIADLNGPATQPIEIALAGRTDSVKGALRNTFETVPDAPVTKFHLELFGGRRGLIELSSGLCRHPRAQIQMDGQNGKTYDTEPVVKTSCKKGKGKKKGGGGKRKGHRRGRGGR